MIPLLVLLLAVPAFAGPPDEVVVDSFDAGAPGSLPPGWKTVQFKKVPRWTEYTLIKEGGGGFVQAVSSAAASAIAKEVPVALKEYPTLTWRWKVSQAVGLPGAKTKKGDDYSARVYVAFRYDPARASLWQRSTYRLAKTFYGEYPPHAALNYVWDNQLPVGTVFDSPYTSRVKLVVMESGDERAGKWMSESRNIYADYRRLFGEEPPPLQFIALMTDTDNTGASVTAWYDDLAFHRRP